MKKLFYLALCVSAIFTSCSEDEIVPQNNENVKVETISGTCKLSEFPKTIHFAGKTIILELMDSTTMPEVEKRVYTKGLTLNGPYYVSGTPRQTNYTNQKLSISNTVGVPTGIYFGDVWSTSGEIRLPQQAMIGTIGMPNPAGYIDWRTREKGVNWSMATTSTGLKLSWHFYTLVLNYNSIGQAVGYVIPLDGAKVKVPYYWQ
ncbi:hypothetical protein [Paraprevotella clara]|uniref:hypothetical protein n=1 Tax=Paraprevotella clara TaxID=454154 RepID=UPI002677326E|nr:hypothetical protein [Paraprevotella clara]